MKHALESKVFIASASNSKAALTPISPILINTPLSPAGEEKVLLDLLRVFGWV